MRYQRAFSSGVMRSMALGFDHPHPGGMVENSPAFQRRDSGERASSPEGTAEGDCLGRPSGTKSASLKACLLTIALACLRPAPVLACAACYGQSDSAMARGMNWGIFSLLAVVVTVLASIATCFICLAKRSATLSASTNPQPAALDPSGGRNTDGSPVTDRHPPSTNH